MRAGILGLMVGATALVGCGNAIDCAISGDNIRGRVNFGPAVGLNPGRQVVIQYSTDAFVSAPTQAKSMPNTQGLVSLPYTWCAPNDTNVTLRAFEDTNGNGAWDAGEAAGRHDGTADGNAAHTVHNLPRPQPSATPAVPWKVDSGVDMTLDSVSAQ